MHYVLGKLIDKQECPKCHSIRTIPGSICGCQYGEVFRFEITAGNDDDVERFINETIANGCIWFDYELPISGPDYPFSARQEEGPEADYIRQSASKHNIAINTLGTRS